MDIKGEVTSINQTMKKQVKIHISLEDMETSKIQGKMKCKMKDMMNLNFNIKYDLMNIEVNLFQIYTM